MALYLYCVRAHTPAEPFFCKGIGGSERVFAIAYKDLDAVVSLVSPKLFGADAVNKKALGDVKWIMEKAKKHETVLEEAMGSGKHRPVIPLKFGTIFKTRRHLLDSLATHHDRFSGALKKLLGKQEWHCKAYLVDAGALERSIRRKSKVVREKEKEMQFMSLGAAYFVDMQITAYVQREKDKMVGRLQDSIFRTLKRHAQSAARGKILAKELTGISGPMIMNSFFLLPDVKIGEFQKTIEHLIKKFPMFHFACSGPWPPYNFV